MELSYSLHLGNDKNKSIKARQEAKNTPSGTTSKNNNAIQNVKQLGKVTKNINDEMDEYAEEFYNDKKDKEKDDGFEL